MSVATWCGIGAIAWSVVSTALALAVGRAVTLAEQHRPTAQYTPTASR